MAFFQSHFDVSGSVVPASLLVKDPTDPIRLRAYKSRGTGGSSSDKVIVAASSISDSKEPRSLVSFRVSVVSFHNQFQSKSLLPWLQFQSKF
jgi:hypothetical protein